LRQADDRQSKGWQTDLHHESAGRRAAEEGRQGPEALSPGKHTIIFDWKVKPNGPPLGRGGTDTLSVDGKRVVQRSLPKNQPIVWAWDETLDDKDYQVPFAFTGKLGKITIDLGESSVSPEVIKLMMKELAQKRDR
jgi:arylsulfatase